MICFYLMIATDANFVSLLLFLISYSFLFLENICLTTVCFPITFQRGFLVNKLYSFCVQCHPCFSHDLTSLAGYRILDSKSFPSDLWIDFSHHRVTWDSWYPSDCHPSVSETYLINHFPALIPPLFFPTPRFSFTCSPLCLLLHVLWTKMTLPMPHSFRVLGGLKPVITVPSCRLLHWSRCGDMSFFFFFLTALGLHCSAWAFSSCNEWGLLSSCGVWIPHCNDFSYCIGSLAVVHRLSCPMACGNLPGPGIKPMSPALAGVFLTTGPPGKSGSICIKETC